MILIVTLVIDRQINAGIKGTFCRKDRHVRINESHGPLAMHRFCLLRMPSSSEVRIRQGLCDILPKGIMSLDCLSC